jgi:hypothetical protein
MAAMEAVRGFKVRLIVSTDVMARGVDFDRVNLVVNVDLPPDPATYVHRCVWCTSFRPGGVCLHSLLEHVHSKLQLCACFAQVLLLAVAQPVVTCTPQAAVACLNMPTQRLCDVITLCARAGSGALGALAAGALLWRC